MENEISIIDSPPHQLRYHKTTHSLTTQNDDYHNPRAFAPSSNHHPHNTRKRRTRESNDSSLNEAVRTSTPSISSFLSIVSEESHTIWAMRHIFQTAKPDVVVHTASPRFYSSKDILYKVNVDGTKNLVQIA
ncbi:hypothetical protein PTTW11_05884 [Pyrenophora teres f. teres]|uniref:3-beta hydroxysteroid dehydrogenase/isomerase domain-containing protein n=1 Tax=Pyrenophora teres f. teres TaxID=97479 RepID=A0A6S6W2N8_9PLEO|nr:hypothetical protein PTTW11_05884 [Pyrenophora teres f. teres]